MFVFWGLFLLQFAFEQQVAVTFTIIFLDQSQHVVHIWMNKFMNEWIYDWGGEGGYKSDSV